MCDPSELGVLYTNHPALAAGTPLASLWSYRSRRSSDRPHRPHEYCLRRSDPLLNTMLPGTHVSLVINFGDPWITGRSLPSSSLLPAISVINEFRGFAGAAPTVFFQPHDDTIDAARIQVRGKPSEWLRPAALAL